ncbi:TIGR04149 family rSAM-modified RiPP [Draconibacterium sp. IB214405]|uniref:TIGR04149 family rSAM-modified RiPP n=1 Tax=Draconibacterium sp. IB214405 TaxID=3097352 RepID=UPI002A103E03|nr:TIGR04149 family rSAM-modified RiPP [Draconibacterium sp. IB214405]MDX8341764.1 TIGR04149 family rSAM-modified RiPP [Draconibacterium sp. IB214405]
MKKIRKISLLSNEKKQLKKQELINLRGGGYTEACCECPCPDGSIMFTQNASLSTSGYGGNCRIYHPDGGINTPANCTY